jgi:eukaryotic-like serine/threonine-protein kinase
MTTSLACLHCHGLLGPGDRFCAHCGAELWWCASCGRFLPRSDEPCPGCGGQPVQLDSSETAEEITADESPWTEVLSRLRRATQGEFEIGHELGRGGMAAVFMAHELSLHRDVAIKVMSPGLLMGDGMVERFRREAITIAHLNHPNIVSVHSVRAAEGLHFFVMRCIQGRSLDQIIADAGKLPLPIARSILSQVGSALAYAHRFKVVHRDIKPANIIIDEEGNAVVTDFGIAKVAEGPSQTHTGFMVGTPAYMSPEQCTGGKVSGASDQYSLGAVAYELVTGLPPFTGSTYTVIQAHVEQTPRPLRDHCDCPEELENAILRMLAKNPDDRWPGMSQALAALGAAVLADDDPLRRRLVGLATPAERATPRTGPPTPPGRTASLTIVPPPPHLEVGDSFLLVARVQDSHAARLPAGPVEWTSDSPNVVRVTAQSVATAIAPGSAVVRATCDGKQGRLRITVSPPRADVIAVKPVTGAINVGDEFRLEAVARDKRGRQVTRPVNWRSEDDAIATISLDGTLVARSRGTVRLVAELDEVSADITLTVAGSKVAAVHISGVPDSVVAGDSFELTATPLDRWAGALKGRIVSWTVSDVGLAIVAAGGWVMTRKPGSVIVTAVCEGVSASVSIDILSRPAAQELPPSPPRSSGAAPWSESENEWEPRTRRPGRERRRSRRGVLLGGAIVIVGAGLAVVGSRGFPGHSSSETATARSDSTRPEPRAETASTVPDPIKPESTAKPEGTALTTPPADSSSGSAPPASAKSRPRRVLQPNTLSIVPREPLTVGQIASLELTGRDQRGRSMSPPAVWSSSDTDVAGVEATTGTVEARKVGSTVITAQAGSESATFSLSVVPEAVGSVVISGARPLKLGDSLALEAEVRDGDGKTLGGRSIAWSSSDPGVVAVDSLSGVVVGIAPGAAEISAMSESVSGRVQVTVLSPPQTARSTSDIEDRQAQPTPQTDPDAERRLLADQMIAGVEECYSALKTKDLARVEQLYRPVTKADRENLKKLTGILRRQEWAAVVGERKDGSQRIDAKSASMDFGFLLTWKDAFGGHLRSEPAFRAEFTRKGAEAQLSSCRIIGSPRL